MRQLALDTETTGLDVRQGHRVIEIACVEIIDRRLSGNHYHTYLNPDCLIDEGARQVTGIADAFLLDKSRFKEVAQEFLDYIDGAELIIHNASFDTAFLDAELARAGRHYGCIADRCVVIDTLALARERYPGKRNSLDALCARLSIDNSARKTHGGLIDAQLLSEVYLAMTSGQVVLELGFAASENTAVITQLSSTPPGHRPRVFFANAEEIAVHERFLDMLEKSTDAGARLWR